MNESPDFLLDCVQSSGLFPRGAGVLVAVSGGVDSMVLLDVLCRLAPQNGWRLVVAHFDHRLRGSASREDAQLVGSVAQRFGVEFALGEGDVRSFATRHKLSVEMAARHLRHRFLAETARSRGLPRIALAHHADDQVELFFVRLLRGAGPDGLSGMRPESLSPVNPEVRLCRPLLQVSKDSLLRYARQNRITYREDHSNASLDIFRNRVRKELLPLLRAQYQPALDQTIPRLMDILRGESDFLRDFVKRHAPSEFAKEPIAVQRRRLQAELERLGVPVDFETIEFLRLHPGQVLCITPLEQKGNLATRGAAAFSRRELIRDPEGQVRLVGRKAIAFKPGRVRLNATKGRRQFGGIKVVWKVTRSDGAPPAHRHGSEAFDVEAIGETIILRHWQKGDRFQPIGMKQAVKLQNLFTNAKIPRQLRHELVLATTLHGEIFWVEGMRIGERFKVRPQTTRSLLWQWERL